MSGRNLAANGWGPVDRRDFLEGTGIVAGGLALGAVLPRAEAQDDQKPKAPADYESNLADFQKVPRSKAGLPGLFPGRVAQVVDPACLTEAEGVEGGKVDGRVVSAMLETGLRRLTGLAPKEAFARLFGPKDVVGIKVNPVGPPLMNTRFELVEAVIRWLADGGLPKGNIVVWDRFKSSLDEAGYTAKNFPGVSIEAIQVRELAEGEAKGRPHPSEDRFDREAFYLVRGLQAEPDRIHKDLDSYRRQHVFTGEHSYFGALVTKRLTRIINLPVFKNAGAGISMATKNLAYAAVCNTGRLHKLFFRTCTEVLAAPWLRDKVVLNVLDAIRAQYDGGPGLAKKFVRPLHTLYVATDPFALDMIGTQHLWALQEKEGKAVARSPRLTEYLHQAAALGLGVADPAKIVLVRGDEKA